MKLSIIVPAYNVESYIEGTVTSLLNQDLRKEEFEILVINDGSTDGTLWKLKNYSEPQIRILNKLNGGVSSARNMGLKNALGTYVMFIDGDDQLKPNSLSSVLEYCFEFDLDICNCRFEKSPAVCENYRFVYVSSLGFSPKENYFKGRDQTIDSSCTHLFKRSFLIENNVFYNEKMKFLEDGEFLIKAYYFSKRAASIDAFIYKRTIREGSATRSSLNISDEALNGYLSAIQNLKELLDLNERPKNKVVLQQGVVKYFIHFYSVVLFKFKFNKFPFIFIQELLNNILLNNFGTKEFYPSDYKYYAKFMKHGLISISFYLFFQKIKSFSNSRFIN